LLKAAVSKGTFTPKKGSKSYGTIAVDECKITGAESPSAVRPVSLAPTATATAYAPSAPLPMPVPVSDLANMSLGGAMPMPVPPPQQRPTFVDYVSGNCDLNMVSMLVSFSINYAFATSLYNHLTFLYLYYLVCCN
jgi:hypothetical protein